MDVGGWLRRLDLEQYEDAFRENKIDETILPILTAEDLKDLGVGFVGHRRKLLDAIAALRAQAGAPPPLLSDAPLAIDKAAKDTAERRQVTVMFSDLVGSTALSAQMDPEDLREVIAAYQKCVAEAVRRFGGFVAKYMGDGVLVYFGYPKAHEDDAERAVRAGLAVVDSIARLATPAQGALAVRVGIATGLVVVGDLIGEGAAQEEAVVGESPNLAARLQALAAPGEIVIPLATRRLLGGLFEFADLGFHELKGFDAPIRAWRVLRESAAETRFEARATSGLAPTVGREHELALLAELWSKAASGEGQVVLLSGEPGIGKSHLIQALRERLRDRPHIRIRCQCSPFHANSALRPSIVQLTRAAGFHPDDPPSVKLDKLERLLARSTDKVRDDAPLLSAFLSLPVGSRYAPLNLSPQRQKELTLKALIRQLVGLAARQPVLLVFEDIHWIDPTSLELLDRLVPQIPRLAVLAIFSFRPEFEPRWIGHPRVTSLALNRLSHRQGAALVERLTGGKALPGGLLEQMVAKTDGVPLFLEEVTKAVIESDVLTDEGDRYALSGPLPPLAIPATLQDSLVARLDRLVTPAREVAQIGAAIGREFSYELLAAVAQREERELQGALDQLISAELVIARGRPPHATCIFKHALVGDAAYATLLRSRRQQLHTRIAHALEQHFGEVVEHEPEIVAQHYTAAGLSLQAIGYWQRAGESANHRSANDEAQSHLQKALNLIETLSAGPERQRRELAALTVLGRVLAAKSGYANPEVEQVYSRARRLCELMPEDADLFPVLLGLAIYSATRAELTSAHELSGRLLDLARQSNDPVWVVEAHYARGVGFSWRGAFREARKHLELASESYRPQRHRAHLALYGQDPGPICLCRGSAVLWQLGYPDQALARMEDALALAERLAHPFSRAYVLTWAAWLRIFRREVAEAEEQNERALTFATEQAYPFWTAMAAQQKGWLWAKQGHRERAIAQIEDSLARMQAVGTQVTQAYTMGLLGEVLGSVNRASDGVRLIDRALDQVNRTREQWCHAELLRLRGALCAAAEPGDCREAEISFRQAVERSREQGAKSWELRAATSLARLLAEQGKRAEAHDLLAPTYGWFTEGFDTLDLKEAKTLLDKLGA
ncbi:MULTISPECIES: AAA family ATPase [unclassified Mesorhizobium]|uniref:AAA family ATPase n=1 Tax=unclassified Mesorhizobium TaxID=325217 RepID=UPI000FCA23E6|nr:MULTISPECIES: AAA family ATPase [unclassified Mesorhizobium]RUW71071.1 hypothetical protein EOA31_18770 [Mesorhizobium sp. M4B.F.Ca.ET.049.02.1.2]TGV24027.1 hypothetical protein EN786_22495 [Mesorhizobium sp. M4B.F.Ca.ET.143.01.1.1]